MPMSMYCSFTSHVCFLFMRGGFSILGSWLKGFELMGSAGEEGIRRCEFQSWGKSFLECVGGVCVCERRGDE